MPTYATHCEACEKTHDVQLSFSDYDAVKLGVKLLQCSICSGNVVLDFAPGDVSFVLKDGESGGWQSKAIRENKWRERHRAVMARRERDHVFTTRLIPNYKGMETGTWRDAMETARSDKESGGNAAAATYKPLVQKETAKS